MDFADMKTAASPVNGVKHRESSADKYDLSLLEYLLSVHRSLQQELQGFGMTR